MDNDRRTQLGRRLARAIKAKGLLQIDVAKKIGVRESALSRILSGKQRASVDQLTAICDELDLPVADFLAKPPPEESQMPIAPSAPVPGLGAFLAEHGDRIAPAVRRHLERSHFVVDEGVVLDSDFWAEQAKIWARRLGL